MPRSKEGWTYSSNPEQLVYKDSNKVPRYFIRHNGEGYTFGIIKDSPFSNCPIPEEKKNLESHEILNKLFVLGIDDKQGSINGEKRNFGELLNKINSK